MARMRNRKPKIDILELMVRECRFEASPDALAREAVGTVAQWLVWESWVRKWPASWALRRAAWMLRLELTRSAEAGNERRGRIDPQ